MVQRARGVPIEVVAGGGCEGGVELDEPFVFLVEGFGGEVGELGGRAAVEVEVGFEGEVAGEVAGVEAAGCVGGDDD